MAADMNDVSMTTEVTSVKTTPTQRRSRVNPVGRVVTLIQQIGETNIEIGTKDGERDEQGEDRNQERAQFGEVMLYSEKHPHEGKAQGQVSTKASLC